MTPSSVEKPAKLKPSIVEMVVFLALANAVAIAIYFLTPDRLAQAIAKLPREVVLKCEQNAPADLEMRRLDIERRVARGEIGKMPPSDTLESVKTFCLQQAAEELDPSLRPKY